MRSATATVGPAIPAVGKGVKAPDLRSKAVQKLSDA